MELQPQKSFVAVLFTGVSVSLWIWWRRRCLRRPPGGIWSLPVLGETLSYVRDPLGFMEAKLSKYGGTCRSHLLFAPTVILAVTDENAKLILSEKDLAWPAYFQKLVGPTSLPMVNDPLHKRIRTLNSRAFGDRQLDSYLPCLQRLSSKHLQLWAEDVDQVAKDLHMEVKKYAFECGEAVILGVENDPLKTARLMQLYEEVFKGLGYILPVDLPGFPFHKCMRSRKLLVQEFQTLIEKKRKKLKDPCRMFQVNTMLDTMLQLDSPAIVAMQQDLSRQAEGMNSEEELSDFCVAMMFAGHDTTLCSIQSCLHWLKACPEVETVLRQEVRACWDGESRITRGLLDSLPQTRAFLQEVWRMTPPVQVM
ncbi:cyp26a1, partial [Symbiodinium pilosum]